MKALSFRQPWAELILQGRKTLDLRTYPTHYRGPLAIHASQTVEPEACRRFGLDPTQLATGGIVGVVELVEVTPLTRPDYEQRQAEHLAGRSYQEGMHGWLLQNPRRLPQLVPIQGRMSLFNVELEPAEVGLPQPDASGTPPPAPQPQPRLLNRWRLTDETETVDRPFELLVKAAPAANGAILTTDYTLTLRQRIIQPPEAQQSFYGQGPAYLTNIVALSGDPLRAVSDHVLDALREAGYKATDLSPQRRAPFRLPEPVGVRLGLVFLTVKPLSKLDRIEAISHGIRQMTPEELYYWYSKCTAADTAERAQKALRVLLAAE